LEFGHGLFEVQIHPAGLGVSQRAIFLVFLLGFQLRLLGGDLPA
jgi:hypothetical protein